MLQLGLAYAHRCMVEGANEALENPQLDHVSKKGYQLSTPMQVEMSFLRPEIGYRVYGSPVALKCS